MSDYFIGELRIFGGNFPPLGWEFCAGQLLPVNQDNEALFQLIGTTYGGDGVNNFALPNLQGRAPIHMGGGFTLGESGGVEAVGLTVNQMPAHSHAGGSASSAAATSRTPEGGNAYAMESNNQTAIYNSAAPDVTMAGAGQAFGGNLAHDNMQPFLAINYIIATQGIFPSPP